MARYRIGARATDPTVKQFKREFEVFLGANPGILSILRGSIGNGDGFVDIATPGDVFLPNVVIGDKKVDRIIISAETRPPEDRKGNKLANVLVDPPLMKILMEEIERLTPAPKATEPARHNGPLRVSLGELGGIPGIGGLSLSTKVSEKREPAVLTPKALSGAQSPASATPPPETEGNFADFKPVVTLAERAAEVTGKDFSRYLELFQTGKTPAEKKMIALDLLSAIITALYAEMDKLTAGPSTQRLLLDCVLLSMHDFEPGERIEQLINLLRTLKSAQELDSRAKSPGDWIDDEIQKARMADPERKDS